MPKACLKGPTPEGGVGNNIQHLLLEDKQQRRAAVYVDAAYEEAKATSSSGFLFG